MGEHVSFHNEPEMCMYLLVVVDLGLINKTELLDQQGTEDRHYCI